MRDPGHVVIAGAGIIGLACALALRQRNIRVSVLEAGRAMKEASWAAAGMLAVQDPENPPELLPLSHYSRGLYTSFLQEITELSALSVPLRTRETVQVIDSSDDPAVGTSLTEDDAKRLIPGLRAHGRRYVLFQEASLDPRDLCAAMPAAAQAAGVSIYENQRVLSVENAGDGVCVHTSDSSISGDVFLNCCGAWSDSLDPSNVSPRKGQMLVIAQSDGRSLTRVLRSPDVYLIPRGDGRIVIGATVEDAGYSKQIEPDALSLLRRRAAALWPPVMDAPLVESWAGLRPGSVDGLPTIGRCNQSVHPRFLATGHYRNGILLAPGTAQAIADLICGATPRIDLEPFAPDRPSISTVCDKHFAAAL